MSPRQIFQAERSRIIPSRLWILPGTNLPIAASMPWIQQEILLPPINTEESQTLSISTEAMLIQIEGDPRVYIVANNFKRHIPSPSVFNAYGYKWSDIKK